VESRWAFASLYEEWRDRSLTSRLKELTHLGANRDCARVAIPNHRRYDPEFDVFPIEELMVQHPL
jgi:hypothetical protein